MPVLIVSEKTWLHEGFSRNRSIRPSSSVTTIPNSSGLSTDLSPIVTAAPFSRAVPFEQLEVVPHAGFADDRPHRFRLVGGGRARPPPPAPRHDDRLHA